LAVVIVPMILITLYRALKGQFDLHRRWARRTWPLWMYVSVTGVVIYWMLYHLYRPSLARRSREKSVEFLIAGSIFFPPDSFWRTTRKYQAVEAFPKLHFGNLSSSRIEGRTMRMIEVRTILTGRERVGASDPRSRISSGIHKKVFPGSMANEGRVRNSFQIKPGYVCFSLRLPRAPPKRNVSRDDFQSLRTVGNPKQAADSSPCSGGSALSTTPPMDLRSPLFTRRRLALPTDMVLPSFGYVMKEDFRNEFGEGFHGFILRVVRQNESGGKKNGPGDQGIQNFFTAPPSQGRDDRDGKASNK